MTLRTEVHQFNVRFAKCSSLSGLLNDNGTRTVCRSCIMRRCRLLMEVLHSFRRKIGVPFGWGTANHYRLRRTARWSALFDILARLCLALVLRRLVLGYPHAARFHCRRMSTLQFAFVRSARHSVVLRSIKKVRVQSNSSCNMLQPLRRSLLQSDCSFADPMMN